MLVLGISISGYFAENVGVLFPLLPSILKEPNGHLETLFLGSNLSLMSSFL